MFQNTKRSVSTQNKYGRLMQKSFYVRPSEFIIFGHWQYNMLNFMSMAYISLCSLDKQNVLA